MNYPLSPKSSVDTSTAMYMQQVTGLSAGEDIPAGQPVRIGVGRKVYKAKMGDKFDGITPRPCKAGQPITVYGIGVRFRATEQDLDPEKLYRLAAEYGAFSDTSPTDAGACFRPVGRHDLEVIRVGATNHQAGGTGGAATQPPPTGTTPPADNGII